MVSGSTLLLAPCELPSKDFSALMNAKTPGMKRRRNTDCSVLGCLSEGSISPSTAKPNKKRSRKCKGLDSRPSKVTWDIAERESEDTDRSPDEQVKRKNGKPRSPNPSEKEKWYSKEDYKQMLMDQCLTVHIMRSLRSLAGETVTSEYGAMSDCNNSRFDELIKEHRIDRNEYCERGLESYLSEDRRNEINAVRKLHKLLVIDEHNRMKDPELVRNASLMQSHKSMIKAQKVALMDQRAARACHNMNDDNNGENREGRNQHQKEHTNTNDEKKMTPLDLLWSLSDQENKSALIPSLPSTRSSPTIGTKTIDDEGKRKNTRNHVEHILRNETDAVSEGIRDTFMDQQELCRILLEHHQQQQQQRCAQYQLQRSISGASHARSNHLDVNSTLSSLRIREQLFHLDQQQIQQLQQHSNYHHHHHQQQQQQMQRLLLLEHHQRHQQSLQLATAVLLGQSQP